MAMEKEHAFKQLEKDIAAGALGSLILLAGEEQYLVDFYRRRLPQLFVEPAVAMLDFVEFEEGHWSVDQIIQACETMPVMSPRKVVVVNRMETLWKASIKGTTEKDMERLCAYLKDLPEDVLLLITGEKKEGEGGGRSKTLLMKTLEKEGKVYTFSPLTGRDLEAFVAKRFRTGGKQISAQLVRRLIGESGYTNKDIDYTLYNLENDIRKVIYHAGGDVILPEDVENSLSDTLEQGVFKLLDAIGARQKGEAMRLLHGILTAGEKPMRLLSLLIGQIEIMLQGMEMRQEGMALPQIQKKLKVNEYRLKKAMQVGSRRSQEDLRRMLLGALAIEGEMKTGYLDFETAMELFIAET